jgi:hypothetical protein
MKKRKLIIIPVIAVLVLAWVFQYIRVNQYFNRAYPFDIQTYQMGEFVPFDEDVLNRILLTGYEIQVESARIMNVEQFFYLYNVNMSDQNIDNLPEKICDVEITIRNVGTDAELDIPGLYLPDLVLHGVDYTTDWNPELMGIANPNMDGVLGVSVPPGYIYTAHVIYNLRKIHFSSFTWSHLENYSFWITMTDYPNRKEIQLSDMKFI